MAAWALTQLAHARCACSEVGTQASAFVSSAREGVPDQLKRQLPLKQVAADPELHQVWHCEI